MFTQCPDCQTTFRVSDKILQQADGRVRCGGCGNPFNALEHLSKKDDDQADESTSDQNKKLLETLDKLAGADVDLEDTGTEWRDREKSDEGDSEDEASETAAMHGRQDDLPRPAPDEQESLDLPETEPPHTKSSERRYDDDTILPDDFGEEDDLDELPFLEAEIPKRRAEDREATQDTGECDDAQVDLALGEPEKWVGLLDEVDDEVTGAEATTQASAEDHSDPEDDAKPETLAEDSADDEAPGEDMPSDIDTQFLRQAEEMGLDTGSHPIVDEEEAGDAAATEEEGAETDETDIADQDQTDIADSDSDEDEEDQEDEADISHEEIEELAELDIEDELAASDNEDAAAAEKSEIIADTIAEAIRDGNDIDKVFDEDSPTVENIIMEGELVGDSISQKRLMDPEAAGKFENLGKLKDTYSLSRGKTRGRRTGDPAGNALIAGVVVLGLLLIGQFIHQSRQSLATYSVFNRTIGSIYRVLGKPVTPDWDIRGWRFEATNGKVDEEEDLLTIYSRIANKSSEGLPYPLVHISLTDRWEDIIGSRVLQPNEYLAGNLDPRKPVPPGENFTAVITIESPSADATGFRLTACYRISPGRVRCADEHFKD